MATKALTMIKENLTTGFLWSAKSIGYRPTNDVLHGALKSAADRDPGGSQLTRSWRGLERFPAAILVKRN
jgi:hypothetical protein